MEMHVHRWYALVLAQKHLLPKCKEVNNIRRQPHCQLTISPKKDL